MRISNMRETHNDIIDACVGGIVPSTENLRNAKTNIVILYNPIIIIHTEYRNTNEKQRKFVFAHKY